MLRFSIFLTASLTLLCPSSAIAQVNTDVGTIEPNEIEPFFPKPGYSPYAGRSFPIRPLFGEVHLHTSWSGDAFGAGTRVGPDDALRFAKGEEVTTSTGQNVRLSRPYDFMMIAHHSDALNSINAIYDGEPELMADPILRNWHDGMREGGSAATEVLMEIITLQGLGQLPDQITSFEAQFDQWRAMTAIVERHDEPGIFTSLIGYEWTSNIGGGNNLHRNVVYRDGKDKADLVRPFTSFDSEIPNKLWDWMEMYEETTGGEVLAIPHNGNLSNGLMFALETPDGQPIDQDWVEARARWEPLVEVTQGKGTSEQHPMLAPSDEFADFEIWDAGNLNVVPKEPGMIEFEYAREALKRGLALEEEYGTNPFKFGLLGSTDSHTGVSTAAENNFFGKFAASEPGPERSTGNAFDFEGRVVKDWQLGASGLMAVWAGENTRESIFDAMKRKEVYGTTGSRIFVRFFGGWNFTAEDAESRNPGAIGYRKGVPMGGDLLPAPSIDAAPTFLVAALRDALSGNLDRIQIVKGWLESDGEMREQVYDVVWSGDRVLGSEGRLPPIGNTVDVEKATWANTIGAPELITVWQDPDFNPAQRAFYYARVLEIPTPRWTAYDAVYYEEADFEAEVPMTLQERAYTSPIWYSPSR